MMNFAQYKTISLAGTSGSQLSSGRTIWRGMSVNGSALATEVTVHDGTSNSDPLVATVVVPANESRTVHHDGVYLNTGLYVYNPTANQADGAVYLS